jgi:hypothetical protein
MLEENARAARQVSMTRALLIAVVASALLVLALAGWTIRGLRRAA